MTSIYMSDAKYKVHDSSISTIQNILTIHPFDKTEPDCSSTALTMDAEPIDLRLLADHLFVTSHLIAIRERGWTSFRPKIGLQ